jgi:hypothetical protein
MEQAALQLLDELRPQLQLADGATDGATDGSAEGGRKDDGWWWMLYPPLQGDDEQGVEQGVEQGMGQGMGQGIHASKPRRVEVRHIIDFLYVGQAIGSDLSAVERAAMTGTINRLYYQ